MIEVSPIRHFRQDQGWVTEDGELFWVDACDLRLNSKDTRQAQSVRSTPFGSEPTRKQEQKKWIGDRFSVETKVESQENRTEN